jgi:hypothetical protein
MCDVPSIAVFCSESIDCFLSIASKFFFKPFVTNPVALIITGIFFPPHCATAHSGPGLPHYRGFTITLRLTTLGRAPLDR